MTRDPDGWVASSFRDQAPRVPDERPSGPDHGDPPERDDERPDVEAVTVDDPDDPDDLAGFTSPMHRLVTSARAWIAAVVVIGLIVPGGAWLADELDFRRSADAVVATLDGELAGAAAADAVLLVRAIGCPGGGNGSGTAFVIDTSDGRALLTNRHVVEDAARVGVRALDGSTDVEVTAVRLSTAADVAILDVADPDALPPALVLADGVREGDTVRSIGFPAATPFTGAGEVARVEGGRLLLDLEVSPGASGSPVVGEDGRVVGQVHAVTGDGQGVATSIDLLRRALGETMAAPPC